MYIFLHIAFFMSVYALHNHISLDICTKSCKWFFSLQLWAYLLNLIKLNVAKDSTYTYFSDYVLISSHFVWFLLSLSMILMCCFILQDSQFGWNGSTF
jgi:hypothetical protein